MVEPTTARTGALVSIDGPGGAGKTTVAALVAAALRADGATVTATREPTDDPAGRLARERVDTYRGRALACLVAADRYQHLGMLIEPALQAGHTVVTDRYVPSSMVLQQLDGVPLTFIEMLNAAMPTPDLAVVLTAPAHQLTERVFSRGAGHRFQTGPDWARRELELYLEVSGQLLQRGWPIEVLDTGERTPAAVAADVVSRLRARISGPQSPRM